jgi:GNAT superfamily N-acetyltransferase
VTEVLGRIEGFDREFEERLCTRAERCRFGTAFFHDRFPRRWDSNVVWVEEPLEGVSAEDLAADADDVQGRAGLEHRGLWVGDAVQGERLAPGFVGLGYGVDRNVVMAHAREPDEWTDERAEQIDLATAKHFYVAAHLEGHADAEAADAQMLADFRDVLVEHADVRFFGARIDGEVVAGCELYRIGLVAQVEDVYTLAEHRGRGLARAAVLAAVRAARGAGADLVFLGADDEDWPKLMYGKLGFDEVARSYDFVKRPPASASVPPA